MAVSSSSALRLTLPVMFGYVPLGFAFGLLFSDLGYAWYYATLMAVAIYAGAAQFLAVGLLAAGTGLWEMTVAVLVLNARHVFYGLSMAPRFPNSGLARGYLIFGLTDETYSLLSTLPPTVKAQTNLFVKITALNQGYWVVGCTLGALLGAELPLNTEGLDFVLTALFVVLALEQAFVVRSARPFVLALIAGVIAMLTVGADHMLLVALALVSLMLWADRYREERHER